MAVDNPSKVLNEKWLFNVDEKDEEWSDFFGLEERLSKMALVYETFPAFKGEQKEEDHGSGISENGSGRHQTSGQSSHVKERNRTQNDHCQLAGGTHKISNWFFRNMLAIIGTQQREINA